MDWQPIETAPKDGTEILVFGSYTYPDDPDPTVYWEIVSYREDPHGYVWTDGNQSSRENVFSHWMPLPPPPTGA